MCFARMATWVEAVHEQAERKPCVEACIDFAYFWKGSDNTCRAKGEIICSTCSDGCRHKLRDLEVAAAWHVTGVNIALGILHSVSAMAEASKGKVSSVGLEVASSLYKCTCWSRRCCHQRLRPPIHSPVLGKKGNADSLLHVALINACRAHRSPRVRAAMRVMGIIPTELDKKVARYCKRR